jgi:hypothetical protein
VYEPVILGEETMSILIGGKIDTDRRRGGNLRLSFSLPEPITGPRKPPEFKKQIISLTKMGSITKLVEDPS